MSELLTTGEMIDRLSVGEVAENEFGAHVTYSGGVLVNKNTGMNLYILPKSKEVKWRILPNYVSFEDAMKALKDGKRVIFHAGEEKYQITSSWCLVNDWVNQFNWNDLMENTWTIEE